MKLLDYFFHKNGYSPPIQRPYIIAEAGVNHEGSMKLAKRLIDEAVEGGAQGIKFQTYRAETLASKNSPSYWDTTKEPSTNQYQLFKKYDKFWKKEFEELKTFCDQAGIEFLSTPFDIESANFLNHLMPAFKIASSDITNLPFIEHICSFHKPILLSTGASYIEEIKEVVRLMDSYDIPYCLLHCILNYPTEEKDANLGMLLDIKHEFPKAVLGYSDHTLPGNMEVLLLANLLGAVIIEKHFTFDKKLQGNDHYHAMDKNDLKLFWQKIGHNYQIIGSFQKKPIQSELLPRRFARRSVVARKELLPGTVIGLDDITWKRPGTGISPKHVNQLIGKTALVHIHDDDIINWDMIK